MKLFTKKILLLVLGFLIIINIFTGEILGAVLKDPKVPNGEQFVWRWKTSENRQFLSIITWKITTRDKKPVYEISLTSGERKKATYIIDKTNLRLIYADVYEVFPEGRCKFTIESKDEKQQLSYNFDNKDKSKVIDNHPYGYNGFILPFSLRGFPFGKMDQLSIYMTPPFIPTNPLWIWKMWGAYIKPLGEEKVTVPAGTFDCYKLELGSSGGIIRHFTTEYYFWFAKEPPHRFVKYQDKDGKNVTELMEIRSKGTIADQ